MFEIQASYFDGSHDVRYAASEEAALEAVTALSPGARYVEATGPNNRRLRFARWHNVEHTPEG